VADKYAIAVSQPGGGHLPKPKMVSIAVISHKMILQYMNKSMFTSGKKGRGGEQWSSKPIKPKPRNHEGTNRLQLHNPLVNPPLPLKTTLLTIIQNHTG
jgi:hypothetical protein